MYYPEGWKRYHLFLPVIISLGKYFCILIKNESKSETRRKDFMFETHRFMWDMLTTARFHAQDNFTSFSQWKLDEKRSNSRVALKREIESNKGRVGSEISMSEWVSITIISIFALLNISFDLKKTENKQGKDKDFYLYIIYIILIYYSVYFVKK